MRSWPTRSRNGVAPRSLLADRGGSIPPSPSPSCWSTWASPAASRPHVSNDNPYSEAKFKTLKYFPEFSGRFGSIQDARAFCDAFFTY
jgi:putative transposase